MKTPKSMFRSEYADVYRVGIPRALLYFRYEVMWKAFFEALGRSVVISPPSDRSIFQRGEALSVDECCLASKLYMGHVDALLGSCDAIFVPSIDNLDFFEGFCTKFQALPDLVKNTFANAGNKEVRVISCEVDKTETGISEEEAYLGLALAFGASKKQAKQAYAKAMQAQTQSDRQKAKAQEDALEELEKRARAGSKGSTALGPASGAAGMPLRILVVGHPYVIHDAFIGGDVVKILRELGVHVLFADEYHRKRALKRSYEFSKTLPWIINRELIGAALELYDHIDGLVLASAFPCGPDSMTNDALVRCIKGKPILSLTIDAQSGTAGLETRLESFVDILSYRDKGGYVHG